MCSEVIDYSVCDQGGGAAQSEPGNNSLFFFRAMWESMDSKVATENSINVFKMLLGGGKEEYC